MQHVQHPPLYFCNIKMKQLQHTSKMSKILESYICNVGERKVSRSTRAPPAPATFVGALDSTREYVRCHDICAPTAMAGSVACATAIGDERTREGASGVSDWDGVWCGGAWWGKGAWQDGVGQTDVRPRVHAETGR
jgi:hypothetical protein